MLKINIAIDGPAGCGKGITSQLLADKLGYNMLDTGAMYRAVALYFVRKKISPKKFDVKYLKDIEIEFDSENRIFLNGEDVSIDIRKPELGTLPSEFSVFPEVREFLVKQQQEIVKYGGYVAEGRDIGSVVIPDAQVKIFLTASAECRAKRRFQEHLKRGESISVEKLTEQIRKRDEIDMAPDKVGRLYKTDDAHEVDNTYMTIDETVNTIYELVEKVIE